MRPNYQCESDENLVEYTLKGDLCAFNVLVKRYRAGVTLVANQITHSHSLAEDITQDVLVIAFRALKTLRDHSQFASWLYAIARYNAYKAGRNAQRQTPTEPHTLEILNEAKNGFAPNPENLYLESEQQAEIATALAALTPEYRLVLLLRYREEWSISQIAIFLSLPKTTVNWRLHQARKTLKRVLTPPQENEEHGSERDTTERNQ